MCVCGGGGERDGRERRRGRISAHSGNLSKDTQKQISILQATKTTAGKEGLGLTQQKQWYDVHTIKGMLSLFTLGIPKKVWLSYQKRYDLYTAFGMIFILLLVWSSYCLWYDLHTTFGMIFILVMVWSSYHFWYDLYTAFGMIFILHMVWSLYHLWYEYLV